MQIKPLKRHPALAELSRDHHQGLLLCWKIRQGLKNKVSSARIKRYADYFFSGHLESHLREEEELVFALLGNGHPMVKRAVAEHKRLRQLFGESGDVSGAMSSIEKELDAHIRFEERELFEEIQKSVPESDLWKLAGELKAVNAKCDTEDWEDKFWEKNPAHSKS